MSTTNIETLNVDNFSDALARSSGLLSVYFYAPWCQPCKAMKPAFSQMATRLANHDMNFGEVDIALSPTIAQTYGIRSVPAVAVFRQRTLVAVIAGEMSPDLLVQRVKKELTI